MAARIDNTALKFNQASIITLLVIGFLANQSWLVAAVAAVMAVGTIWPRAGLFKLLYTGFLKPAGMLRPEPVEDDPQPHLFAQGLGAIVLVLALAAFALGAGMVGWGLAALVAVLAAVNLLFGLCLGCFLYYQSARHGLILALPWWRHVQVK